MPFLSRHILILLVCCSSWSCILKEEEPPPTPPEYENAQKPADNTLIRSETTFGSANNNSQFIFSETSNTGNFYVVGSLDNAQASTDISVGRDEFISYYDALLTKFDASGKQIWERRPAFSIYRHMVIPKGVLGPLEYVVLTGYDENESDPNDPDRNRIMLYDENGVFKSNFSYDFYLRLNGLLIAENTSEYVKVAVVGSVYKFDKANYYPAYCTFKIRKSNLEIYDFLPVQIVDALWENVLFENILYVNGKYVVSGYANDGKPGDETHLQVHVSVHSTLDLKQYMWRASLKNTSSNRQIYHLRRGLAVADGKVYVCGFMEDRDKAKDSGGNYWNSPYLACFSLQTGDKLFDFKYPISETSDKFYSLKIHNDAIYVGGISSNSYCVSCSKEFTIGNGLLCKINPDNGDLISHRTFGGSTYRTFISECCILPNGMLWAAGHKRYTNQNGLAWLIGVNVNDI